MSNNIVKARRTVTTLLYGLLALIAGIIIIFGTVFILQKSSVTSKLYSQINTYIVAIIIFVVGYFVINYIIGIIMETISSSLKKHEVVSIKFVFQVIAYFLLFIIIFYVLKIDLSGLVLGGAFAGIVIGLAAQTVLSNLFAGFIILFVKNLKIGDKITFVTWQYSLIAPTYSPKFYSQDFVTPGYTGTIEDISYIYVVLRNEENKQIFIPTSIFIQSLIINHSQEKHSYIKIRYEVDKKMNIENVMEKIIEKISEMEGILKPSVNLTDITSASYVLSIKAMVKIHEEETQRTKILLEINKAANMAAQKA
ncbi:MAG: mechanosensitive ion channel family protein [Thermoplasmata archaeon]